MSIYPKEVIEKAVSESKSLSDVFKKIGVSPNGGSYPWMRRLIKNYDISISHFSSIKNKEGEIKSRAKSQSLRSLLKASFVEEKCNICQISQWMGNPLRLDVDHIDGDHSNNNLDNLQFICPNCHRQKTVGTELSEVVEKKNSCKCGKKIGRKSSHCSKCSALSRFGEGTYYSPKLPPIEDFKEMVWNFTLEEISKKYKLSVHSIAKNCERNRIPTPSLSPYWIYKKQGNDEMAEKIRLEIESSMDSDNSGAFGCFSRLPNIEEFKEMVWNTPINLLMKKFKMSRDNLKKYMKINFILSPLDFENPVSYWAFYKGKNFEKCFEIRSFVESNMVNETKS